MSRCDHDKCFRDGCIDCCYCGADLADFVYPDTPPGKVAFVMHRSDVCNEKIKMLETENARYREALKRIKLATDKNSCCSCDESVGFICFDCSINKDAYEALKGNKYE